MHCYASLTMACYEYEMFGPRLNKVFASRLNALWWSAMVLMTAYCVAADPPAHIDGVGGAEPAKAEKNTGNSGDPWAKVMKDRK
ncbi:hypothetical protein [Parasphingorhabdus halotolerans]|nr:hypothetical protein [Parasphingorhabdus halotolerans]